MLKQTFNEQSERNWINQQQNYGYDTEQMFAADVHMLRV